MAVKSLVYRGKPKDPKKMMEESIARERDYFTRIKGKSREQVIKEGIQKLSKPTASRGTKAVQTNKATGKTTTKKKTLTPNVRKQNNKLY